MRESLDKTGRAVWDAFQADKLDSGAQTLVLAYARAADIADRLNGLAVGRQDSWATLVFDDMGEVHLGVDKILDQHRAQLLAIKQLHAELRQAGIKPVEQASGQTAVGDEEDMLSKRRREREAREHKLG